MSELLNYARQSHQPEWFEENWDHFYHAVTSGSSPFNQWYEFESEEDALEFALRFESQSVIDHFEVAAFDSKDRWFHREDIAVMADGWDPAIAKKDARPAAFADLAQAESPF
tara:strand:+ start:559 stop:894 length:336 start_codon:yes stop_codon:yes gene_type:complete